MKITFKVAESSKPILTIEENGNHLEKLPHSDNLPLNPFIQSRAPDSNSEMKFKKIQLQPAATLYYPLHEMKAQMKEFFYKRTGKQHISKIDRNGDNSLNLAFSANSSVTIRKSVWNCLWETLFVISFIRAIML